jgi:hypothetical protein
LLLAESLVFAGIRADLHSEKLKNQREKDSLAVDGVCCELFSRVKFPANREKYREFSIFEPKLEQRISLQL